MKKLFIVLVLTLLVSSCAPAEVVTVPASTLTSLPEFIKTPVPTATETPLPTLIPTVTLPPVAVECNVDKNITEDICPFVENSVLLGRAALIRYFGRDIQVPVKFHFSKNPDTAIENTDIPHASGGAHMDKFLVVQINTENKIWRDFGTEDAIYRRVQIVLHEMTHIWQAQNKCNIADSDQLLQFMSEGQAQYVALMGGNHPELFNPAQAGIMWIHMGFVERDWIDSADVSQLAFKDLVDTHSPINYTEFCGLLAQGKKTQDAFQAAFGVSSKDFRKEFKERSLGTLKDCTQAICGDPQYGKLVVDPVYGTLTNFIDHSLTEPNLIVNFTDENGKPAENTILTICRLAENNGYDCSGGEDRPINSEGKFIRPLEVGRYRLEMCDPGYAENSGNPIKCVYETKPFDIVAGQITTIDFQFHHIQKTDGVAPNLEFALTDIDGNPVPNQYIQICADEPGSYICLNTKTDSTGQYSSVFVPGKYVMRFVRPGQGDRDPRGASNPDKYGMHLNRHYSKSAEYEIQDININDSAVTKVAFQYPLPNFQINFEDIFGEPFSPNLWFWMCKAESGAVPETATGFTLLKDQSIPNGIGDCSYVFEADKAAIFRGNLEPGKYFIFFNVTRPFYAQPAEYELADIYVPNKTELTEITFQPK